MAKSTKEEKLIKQVNERIKDVARLLGTDSKLYNDYKSRVDKVFDTSQYHISSKDGVIQISHGKKVQGIEDLEERLDFIKRLPTKGEVLRRAKNSLKEEGEKTIGRKGRENVVERSKQIDLINDFLRTKKTISTNSKNSPTFAQNSVTTQEVAVYLMTN